MLLNNLFNLFVLLACFVSVGYLLYALKSHRYFKHYVWTVQSFSHRMYLRQSRMIYIFLAIGMLVSTFILTPM